MDFFVYINDTLVSEPEGMRELEISIRRDDEYHGIGFEATTDALKFRGDGYALLKSLHDTYLIDADIVLRIMFVCDDSTEPQLLYTGKANMGTYKENCGSDCFVSLMFEENSCITVLRNRFDQKVDLDVAVAFDKTTALTDAAPVELELTAVELMLQNEAELSADVIGPDWADDPTLWFDNITPSGMSAYIVPAFDTLVWGSLGTFNGAVILPEFHNGGANNRPAYLSMFPTVNIINETSDIECAFSDVDMSFRLQGQVTQVGSSGNTFLTVKVFKLAAGADGSNLADWTQLYDNDFATVAGSTTVSFDVADTLTFPLETGERIYFGVYVLVNDADNISSFIWQQTGENFLQMQSAQVCENSTTEGYLVYEALNRIVEAITDKCAQVDSAFFGRTDSTPIAKPQDGCSSLRFVTSGLKIRNAEKPYFFLSMKTAIDSLNAIDNIGFDVLQEISGTTVRVENVEFFYQPLQILSLDFIPEAETLLREDMHVSVIKIGYKRWEIENINGLDEFNSNREYRTRFKTIDNVLERLSDFVAGSYPIEITRRQSFAKTGAEDTTYDNEPFIICVKRSDSNFIVEKEIFLTADNVFSPETKYNMRITPVRNLAKWFPSIANAYADPNESTSKLYFVSGTGNIDAAIELDSSFKNSCEYLWGVVVENEDLDKESFYDGVQYNLPPMFWRNSTVSFEYPLTFAQYQTIKSNPYGYISYQCGTGIVKHGWIKEVRFSPIEGIANFTLIKQYEL